MDHAREEKFKRIVSGQAKGLGAAMVRAMLSLAEPIYSGVMRVRNWRYKKGSDPFFRPVVSVGNITTGGTGKTPVVHWLAGALRAAGQRPAVLMRGYKARVGEMGDEERLLDGLLNVDGQVRVPIQANPDRRAGGVAVLQANPETSVFILDDGFQHRRMTRQFDLVLIDAVNPFGYGHVLPRGLLREPLCGLGRAHAILITRADQVDADALDHIEKTIRNHNPSAPIYRSSHAHTALLTPTGPQPITSVALSPVALFTGIGNPQAFSQQVGAHFRIVTQTFFSDHHPYSRADIDQLIAGAREHGASALLTTEKDYVKVARLLRAEDLPVWRPQLTIQFWLDHEGQLFEQIRKVLQ